MVKGKKGGSQKTEAINMRLDPELKGMIDEIVRRRRMQTGEDVRFSEVARELLRSGMKNQLEELASNSRKKGDD